MSLYASLVIFDTLTAVEAIAQPTRRRILDLLRERERPVGAEVELLVGRQHAAADVVVPVRAARVHHERAVLGQRVLQREVDLVGVRADAQRRLYRVRPEPLEELDAWLAPYRRMWSTSLDALERHLDEGNGTT